MARPRLDRPTFRLVDRGGIWYIRWWKAGAWHRATTGTSNRREAERHLAQFVATLEEPPPPQQRTVGEILDGYLADRQGQVASIATLKYACNALRRHLGDLAPENLTVRRSRLYAEQRRQEGHLVGPATARTHKPTSDGTITRELVTLRAAIRWAITNAKWLRPEEEPKIEVPSASPPRDRWLSREEAQILLEACVRPHIKLFVAIGLYTAARSGAILELTWDRVDFQAGMIHYGRGVGNKGRASVPISPKLLPYLLQARSGATCDWVIEHAGRQVGSIKKGFGLACQRAQLGDDVTPHILRHTAATWMAMEGVPMAQIAKFLGNSEKITERVYAKHHPDYLRDAVSAL